MESRNSQSPLFGCFTLQPKSCPGTVFLSEVGADGDLARKRKAHTKSRLGCTGCKARKVKCDEKQPCRNCVRRSQECIRPQINFRRLTPMNSTTKSATRTSLPRTPPHSILLNPSPELPLMNRQHLSLLHHFEAFTAVTFVMEPERWKKAVVQLALQHEFLMHAIFLVTAAHLEHLQPADKTHHIVALQNLSLVLPPFRKALDNISDDKECSVDLAEALISCSMLLMQFSWHLDAHVLNNSSGLSGLYRGLMSVTLSCLPRVTGGTLFPMLYYSPRLHIERCMKVAGTKSSVDEVFTHVLACDKISDIQPEDPEFFSQPLQRLNSIYWALDASNTGSGEADLDLAAARYLFSLPNWLPNGFVNKFKLHDGRAQVILLYFFAAILKLKSERFWWMRKRALFIFGEIARILGDRCVECTGHAHDIFQQEC